MSQIQSEHWKCGMFQVVLGRPSGSVVLLQSYPVQSYPIVHFPLTAKQRSNNWTGRTAALPQDTTPANLATGSFFSHTHRNCFPAIWSIWIYIYIIWINQDMSSIIQATVKKPDPRTQHTHENRISATRRGYSSETHGDVGGYSSP